MPYKYEFERPGLTVDCVIFGLDLEEESLRVMLVERDLEPFAGRWAIPGGFVRAGESLEDAAARELKEETGITVPTAELRQVGAFDAVGRDPRGRYVSVAYTATLPALVEPTAGDDATAARWWPLADLPDLAFDHAEIVAEAVKR
jgi:8-oxo-dGTP diphosphatase